MRIKNVGMWDSDKTEWWEMAETLFAKGLQGEEKPGALTPDCH